MEATQTIDTQTTKMIRNRVLTLTRGRRYTAYGPVSLDLKSGYAVSILDIHNEAETPIETLTGFMFDDAETFVAEFNDDPNVSFHGRVWV